MGGVAPIWFAKEGGSLRPVTWQGWFATAAFLVLLIGAAWLGSRGIVLAVLIFAGYIGLIALTRRRD